MRDVYFYRLSPGGIRRFDSLVREDKAYGHLSDLREASVESVRAGRLKKCHVFEARLLDGEKVEPEPHLRAVV